MCERPPGALVIGRFSDATKIAINTTLTFVDFGLLLSFSDYFRKNFLAIVVRRFLFLFVANF
jgi:hypothetical protein